MIINHNLTQQNYNMDHHEHQQHIQANQIDNHVSTSNTNDQQQVMGGQLEQQQQQQHHQQGQQQQQPNQQQHGPKPRGRRKKIRTEPIRPICPQCEKQFSNQSALTKHKLTHSDERKFACQQCSKAFKRHDHLTGHMQTHSNRKPFNCTIQGCDKTYCDARSLRRHKENIHHIVTPREINHQGNNNVNQQQQQQQHHHHHHQESGYNHHSNQPPFSADYALAQHHHFSFELNHITPINQVDENNNQPAISHPPHSAASLTDLSRISSKTTSVSHQHLHELPNQQQTQSNSIQTYGGYLTPTTLHPSTQYITNETNQHAPPPLSYRVQTNQQHHQPSNDPSGATTTNTASAASTPMLQHTSPTSTMIQTSTIQETQQSSLYQRRIQRHHSDGGSYGSLESSQSDRLDQMRGPAHLACAADSSTQNHQQQYYTNYNHHHPHVSYSADYASTQHFDFDMSDTNRDNNNNSIVLNQTLGASSICNGSGAIGNSNQHATSLTDLGSGNLASPVLMKRDTNMSTSGEGGSVAMDSMDNMMKQQSHGGYLTPTTLHPVSEQPHQQQSSNVYKSGHNDQIPLHSPGYSTTPTTITKTPIAPTQTPTTPTTTCAQQQQQPSHLLRRRMQRLHSAQDSYGSDPEQASRLDLINRPVQIGSSIVTNSGDGMDTMTTQQRHSGYLTPTTLHPVTEQLPHQQQQQQQSNNAYQSGHNDQILLHSPGYSTTPTAITKTPTASTQTPTTPTTPSTCTQQQQQPSHLFRRRIQRLHSAQDSYGSDPEQASHLDLINRPVQIGCSSGSAGATNQGVLQHQGNNTTSQMNQYHTSNNHLNQQSQQQNHHHHHNHHNFHHQHHNHDQQQYNHHQQVSYSADYACTQRFNFDFTNHHMSYHHADHPLSSNTIPLSADSITDSGLGLNIHFEQQMTPNCNQQYELKL